ADVLDALGRAQQASGELNQAISTYSKLSDLQPNSPMPFMRMADLFLASKNKDSAAQSLKKALGVKPDLLDAQRGLITLGMDAKKISESVAIAKVVQKQRPKESIGYIFEGDIAAAQKNWDEAASIYRIGLKEAPGTELALKLHTVLLAAAKPAEADKFAGTWLKENA
ncbi:MAG: hypothetical protein CFE44_29275, partial [Burkholderiales bacterium PBB4]